MAEIRYSKTTRGGSVLIHEHFMYTLEKRMIGKTFWRCRQRTCSGRLLMTTDDKSVKVTIPHFHVADKAGVLADEARVKIKERAIDNMETPRQLYQNCIATMPKQAAALLKFSAVQRNVSNARQRIALPLAQPTSLKDIETDPYMKRTLDDEPFLLEDTGAEDTERIIVFGTQADLRELLLSEIWLGDGTFKACPPLFMQVYTIHGVIKESTVPLLYALLPNKSARTYKRLFQVVSDGISELPESSNYASPKMMVMDFEQAAIKAFKNVFKATKTQGELNMNTY